MARRLDPLVKAVRRGARLLDRCRPGWWRRIRLRDLQVARTRNCVLGQAYDLSPEGWRRHNDALARIHSADPKPPSSAAPFHYDGYDRGLYMLGLTKGSAGSYGFALPESHIWSVKAWDVLTEAWADEVRKRRKAAA